MKDQLRNFLRRYPALYRTASFVNLHIRYQIARHQWAKLAGQPTVHLELGSGPKRGGNGWVTVDQYGSDIIWDLRKGIPLPDQSVSKIYSSHLPEHIPYKGLLIFLRECRRILKDQGEFIVCVPNARLYIEAYLKSEFFIDRNKWYGPAVVDTGSYLDQVNYIANLNEDHKTLFDQEYLLNILKKSGFRHVQTREFDSNLDSAERHFESLYALAIR